MRALGLRAVSTQVDVCSKDSVQRTIAEAVREFQTLHVSCSNAGVSTMNRVVDLSEQEWDFNMDVYSDFMTGQAINVTGGIETN